MPTWRTTKTVGTTHTHVRSLTVCVCVCVSSVSEVHVCVGALASYVCVRDVEVTVAFDLA